MNLIQITHDSDISISTWVNTTNINSHRTLPGHHAKRPERIISNQSDSTACEQNINVNYSDYSYSDAANIDISNSQQDDDSDDTKQASSYNNIDDRLG